MKKTPLAKVISLALALMLALSVSAPAFADAAPDDFDAALEEEFNAIMNGDPEMDVTSLLDTLPDLAEKSKVDPADVVPMAAIDPVVLVDNDSITATVTGYTPMSEDGPAFDVELVNKTDKTLCFSAYDVSVNGFMVDPYWAKRVDPGEQKTGTMAWDPDDLAESGINYIETVEARLWVYDDQDYEADDVFNDVVTWTADTSNAEGPACETPEFDFTAVPALSGNVSVSVVAFDEDYDNGPTMTMFVKNDSDTTVLVRAENVTVNGKQCSPYWFEKLAPGKAVYSHCHWDMTALKTAGVEAIEKVDMKITAADDATYETFASNTISISPAQN